MITRPSYDNLPAWSWQFAPDQIQQLSPIKGLEDFTPEWAWGGSTGAGVKAESRMFDQKTMR